jgi:hypothetical protein
MTPEERNEARAKAMREKWASLTDEEYWARVDKIAAATKERWKNMTAAQKREVAAKKRKTWREKANGKAK